MIQLHRKLSGIFLLFFLATCGGSSPEPETESSSEAPSNETDEGPRGIRVNKPDASPGYVLFTPLRTGKTFLVDDNGRVVHAWESDLAPGTVYLLDNGHLLRTEQEPEVPVFSGGGQSGRIREYTWEGELVWDFLFANEDHLLHHDIEPLPNGNILAIAWESKTAEESRQAGRRENRTPEAGLWPDMVVELEPQPPDDARIVWEWHAWDHLVQNTKADLAHYGEPSEHPHQIDINGDVAAEQIDPKELEQLKALGYVPEETEPEDLRSDLFHTNAIHYNAALDQIVLSSPRFDEIWIIDHSTTTVEAAGSTGGRWGRGGDLLYRWGNALAYGGAENTPKQLSGQHDVRWIPEGFPGSGHLMAFNNDFIDENENHYSAIVEIAPPVDAAGQYVVPDAGPFGPVEPVWRYEDKGSFHSRFISGAHRLPNGNTFICSGAQGRFLEVTPAGEIVWEYWNPYTGNVNQNDRLDEDPYAVFRATKIPPDHPALAGKDLTPQDPQPPIVPPSPPREGETEK